MQYKNLKLGSPSIIKWKSVMISVHLLYNHQNYTSNKYINITLGKGENYRTLLSFYWFKVLVFFQKVYFLMYNNNSNKKNPNQWLLNIFTVLFLNTSSWWLLLWLLYCLFGFGCVCYVCVCCVCVCVCVCVYVYSGWVHTEHVFAIMIMFDWNYLQVFFLEKMCSLFVIVWLYVCDFV